MSFFVIAFLIVILDVLTMWGIKGTFPRFASRHKFGLRTAFIIQVTLSLVIVFGGFFLKDHTRDYRLFAIYYYLFGLMLAVYLPKCLFILSLCIDLLASTAYRRKRKIRNLYPREPHHIPAKFGLVLGLLFLLLIFWGIFFGRYAYTVEHVEIGFTNLPEKFNGFRIVQISDVHAGSSAGMTGRFRKAIDIINAQKPDVILFTGDMVNNFAEEAYPLIPIFSKMDAPDGKYATLGNHDYGIYYDWDTPSEQKTNHQNLEHVISSMGFRLLNNDAVTICKDSLNCIAIVGVENWGAAERHPKKGDIEQALKNVQHVPFKILLSHDPSYWTEAIVDKTDIQLTLAGHTHGMQMGIKFGKHHYSPARLHYKFWAGLYHIGNQYLYVNRGLGVIGFPGRIGMSPEITVIDLKREN